ncbi:hypothetical protein [Brachybacterium sp. GPGPB12]|uniref:hypothetical protein n=1 Tax=Brachybacterium sp. GPGPB12 TaxID=3023517 RepID=UPI0031345C83
MVGGGISHWFVVWLIAATYGAAGLGNYSVVLAGATPLFIFLGLGLRNVYVSVSGAPRWHYFLRWRIAGLAIAFVLLAVYCLIAAPYWGIFLGLAVMKVADGFSDIACARIQRQGRFTLLGGLTCANALASIAVISFAAWISAPIGVPLACFGAVSFVLGVCATVLGRSSRFAAERGRRSIGAGWPPRRAPSRHPPV